MRRKDKGILNIRLIHSYLSSIISISLVLLLAGVAGLLVVNAKAISDYFKENITVSAILKVDVADAEAEVLKKRLDGKEFVKSINIISKEQGIKEMKELLGETFLDVFETNPIPISLDIQVNADYVSRDSLLVVERVLANETLISEISYQESLIDLLNSNIEKIGMILGIFILLLLFISFVLINNTVRLNIYSKRFTIHTMRLVGATRAFIRRPFITQAFFQGFLAALIAVLGLFGILYMLQQEFPQLFLLLDINTLLIVASGVIALGAFICMISTAFVVNKLVDFSKDDLYY